MESNFKELSFFGKILHEKRVLYQERTLDIPRISRKACSSRFRIGRALAPNSRGGGGARERESCALGCCAGAAARLPRRGRRAPSLFLSLYTREASVRLEPRRVSDARVPRFSRARSPRRRHYTRACTCARSTLFFSLQERRELRCIMRSARSARSFFCAAASAS